MPAVLPESATDIRETHNVDSNVGYGTFQFGLTDAFQAALTPIPAGHSVRSASRKELESSGYILYTYEDFDIAVDWKDRRGSSG